MSGTPMVMGGAEPENAVESSCRHRGYMEAREEAMAAFKAAWEHQKNRAS